MAIFVLLDTCQSFCLFAFLLPYSSAGAPLKIAPEIDVIHMVKMLNHLILLWSLRMWKTLSRIEQGYLSNASYYAFEK